MAISSNNNGHFTGETLKETYPIDFFVELCTLYTRHNRENERANMTYTKQTHFKHDDTFSDDLTVVCQSLGLKKSAAIRLAIAKLSKQLQRRTMDNGTKTTE